MRRAVERRIAHQIVTAGRSTPCEYESVDDSHASYKSLILSSVVVFLIVLSVVVMPMGVRAGTSNITTYWDVQSQVSISVSFPTGLTNISFTDTNPRAVFNVSSNDASGTTYLGSTPSAEVTDTGDTNITLTGDFTSAFPSVINFLGLDMFYNTSNASTEGTDVGTYWDPSNHATGTLGVFWKPANYSNTQDLTGNDLGKPGLLNPYDYPYGAYAENVIIYAFTEFNADVYAGQATDTFTITYSV